MTRHRLDLRHNHLADVVVAVMNVKHIVHTTDIHN